MNKTILVIFSLIISGNILANEKFSFKGIDVLNNNNDCIYSSSDKGDDANPVVKFNDLYCEYDPTATNYLPDYSVKDYHKISWGTVYNCGKGNTSFSTARLTISYKNGSISSAKLVSRRFIDDPMVDCQEMRDVDDSVFLGENI